ncbi:MAG: hypothetical protein OER86_13100, partial [Phycisphaerae bacterium]|nr:hypothetical protein [Phycisphaerae bacterium]
ASDLLPELQFHDHDRIKLTVALLLGLAVAWASGLVEHGGHEDHDDHAAFSHQLGTGGGDPPG